jgi:hypothetical protein
MNKEELLIALRKQLNNYLQGIRDQITANKNLLTNKVVNKLTIEKIQEWLNPIVDQYKKHKKMPDDWSAVAFIENGDDDCDLMDILYSAGDGVPYVDIRIEEKKNK